MASAAVTIKKSGFTTLRIDVKHRGIFGGNKNHVIALVNAEGNVLCYEGEPYFPIGRIKTYAVLIETGQLSSKCFSFEPLNA